LIALATLEFETFLAFISMVNLAARLLLIGALNFANTNLPRPDKVNVVLISLCVVSAMPKYREAYNCKEPLVQEPNVNSAGVLYLRIESQFPVESSFLASPVDADFLLKKICRFS
jgi:hypothetical protein